METELLKSKQHFELWVPPFLSYELWKQQIQTPPYIFHFNIPQVNLIFDQALKWPLALEFGHHWGMGVRVIRGTKCSVYKCLPLF